MVRVKLTAKLHGSVKYLPKYLTHLSSSSYICVWRRRRPTARAANVLVGLNCNCGLLLLLLHLLLLLEPLLLLLRLVALLGLLLAGRGHGGR